MSDQSFFSTHRYRNNVQIFTSTKSAALGAVEQIWKKPKNASMVSFTAIGAGGGGGAGFNRTSGSGGGGGGSGASGGIFNTTIPAMFLPDILYVYVGGPGAGGNTSGASGITAGGSQVSCNKAGTTPCWVCSVSNTGGGGGGGGAAIAGTGAATAGSFATNNVPYGGMGFAPGNGQIGVVGLKGGASSGSVGQSCTGAWDRAGLTVLSQAAGGGGTSGSTNFGGGSIQSTAEINFVSSGFYPLATGSMALGGTGSEARLNGSAGVSRLVPFFNTGGAGGSSNDSGSAGHGGIGGWGCGGGGGGAGTTFGKGGNGGQGLIVIVSW